MALVEYSKDSDEENYFDNGCELKEKKHNFKNKFEKK